MRWIICICNILVLILTNNIGWCKKRSSSSTTQSANLQNLNYKVFPVRTQEEAAVIEWGHSAIISALDAAVAYFGPQTTQAALLEVETKPVLAEPLNGIFNDNNADAGADADDGTSSKIRALDNADEVFGNVAIMTDTAIKSVTEDDEYDDDTDDTLLDGLDLALIAQKSGAAALIVVHVNNNDRPDDIYRLPIPIGREQEAEIIDIPVVVISTSSANVLMSALAPEDEEEEYNEDEDIQHAMPDRIRLYAGGDRPFFEDVEAAEPTIYVIHNLLSNEECDSLIQQAEKIVKPVTRNDPIHYTVDYEKFVNVERVHLWQGLIQGPQRKAVEERIEQVTGFPSIHYSDFIIDKLSTTTGNSYWQPHYDTLPGNYVPLATITVFLSEYDNDTMSGGEIVFPTTQNDPVKIRPVRGMAVVHHNTNEKHQFEMNSLHALLPISTNDDNNDDNNNNKSFYIARKFILPLPVSNARKVGLPIIAFIFGGILPQFIISIHDMLIDKFGIDAGSNYFDKLIIFFPVLILLAIAQLIAKSIMKQQQQSQQQQKQSSKTTSKTTTATTKQPKSKPRKKKD